eukprot:2543462-Amphidinium_carterae.1
MGWTSASGIIGLCTPRWKPYRLSTCGKVRSTVSAVLRGSVEEGAHGDGPQAPDESPSTAPSCTKRQNKTKCCAQPSPFKRT